MRRLMQQRSLLWPLYKRLLQRSTRPILVGPFRGEVGFEALYWVPFIKALGLAPERLIPITRGGAHLWYEAQQSCDLFSLRDPKDVRVENMYQQKRTGLLKQVRVSAFDRSVVRDAARQLGLSKYLVLHPAWMYRTLEDYWEGRRGVMWLLPQLRVAPFTPVLASGLTLPDQFVAARFYYRHTFQATDVAKTVAIETIKHLAQSHTVVVMNADLHTDEHVDVPVPDLPNVIQLKGQAFVTPQNNLAVQSAILSKALGFVGTYGGLAQLATMYRKPSISFYTEWGGTMLAHKHLADALALHFGVSCQVLRVTEMPLLREVLPAVAFRAATSSGVTDAPDPVFAATA